MTGKKDGEVNILIRNETEKDYFEAESMTREAFWDVYKPGCDEHLLLHQLRNSGAFVPELCCLACDGDTIAGNIVYTKAVVRNEAGEHLVLCMGPLSVLPVFQNKGIGSKLLNFTLGKAAELGYAAVVIFGNPAYYHRFGFRNAAEYGIQTSDGRNFDPFMVLDLRKDGLKEIHGRFFEDKAFAIDPHELEEFEKNFPPREKHVRPGQLDYPNP